MKGNNTKSIRKKQLGNTRKPVVGVKNIKFHHQAVEGDTVIDLTGLTLPAGLVNPSPAVILKAQIKTFSENFFLTSNQRPSWMEGIAYEVISNSSIRLIEPALDGEVFTGVFQNGISVGTVIADVRTPAAHGTLLEGQTDFALGEAIPIKDLNNNWPIQNFRGLDGKPMQRNTLNGTTGGNYQMIDNGDGFCSVIRYNIAGDVGGEPIMWASHGALGERPNASVLQQVDSLFGTMDRMSQDLLEVTGFDVEDPTRYDGVPTNADLKAFGDKVQKLEKILGVEILPDVSEVVTYTGFISKNGSNQLLLKTSKDDFSNKYVAVTNTDHTRYTFLKECDFVSVFSNQDGTASNNNEITMYNALDVQILTTHSEGDSSGPESCAMVARAKVGDYIIARNTQGAVGDTLGTNFSVRASGVTKKKIQDLI